MTAVASNQLFFSKHCLLPSHRTTSSAKHWVISPGKGTSPACEAGLDSGFDFLAKFPNRERSAELEWCWEGQLPSVPILTCTRTESFPLGASSLSLRVTPGPGDAGWLEGHLIPKDSRCSTASDFLLASFAQGKELARCS